MLDKIALERTDVKRTEIRHTNTHTKVLLNVLMSEISLKFIYTF